LTIRSVRLGSSTCRRKPAQLLPISMESGNKTGQGRVVRFGGCPGGGKTRGSAGIFVFVFFLVSAGRKSPVRASVSVPEPNSPITRVVSRGRRNTGLQFIRRSVKSQRLSRPLIQP